MRSIFTQQSLSTDDQGHFRLAGLQPGNTGWRRLKASAQAPSAREAAMAAMFGSMIDPGALHFYSGDTIHRKAAKTYELRAGDEVTGIEITIPEHAFHQLRGRVAGTSGEAREPGRADLDR